MPVPMPWALWGAGVDWSGVWCVLLARRCIAEGRAPLAGALQLFLPKRLTSVDKPGLAQEFPEHLAQGSLWLLDRQQWFCQSKLALRRRGLPLVISATMKISSEPFPE